MTDNLYMKYVTRCCAVYLSTSSLNTLLYSFLICFLNSGGFLINFFFNTSNHFPRFSPNSFCKRLYYTFVIDIMNSLTRLSYTFWCFYEYSLNSTEYNIMLWTYCSVTVVTIIHVSSTICDTLIPDCAKLLFLTLK